MPSHLFGVALRSKSHTKITRLSLPIPKCSAKSANTLLTYPRRCASAQRRQYVNQLIYHGYIISPRTVIKKVYSCLNHTIFIMASHRNYEQKFFIRN